MGAGGKTGSHGRGERGSSLVLEPGKDFFVGFHHVAEVLAEAVLVQLLLGGLVPQTAGIRGNLIRQNDLAVVAAELDLEVDQIDV